ncbi:MAG: GHKL domain-containing protein [Clostridia bacterium]|nr:GHKL domain-containing protein [Clostridia bacterium]
MDDHDLVVIMGNLLDNAVDAAEKSEDKAILLETDNRNRYAVIVITNSCDSPPAASGEKLLSTKNDRTLHGIGLKTVKKTLQKYGGDYGWEYLPDEKKFIMTVMLSQQ